MFLNPSLEFPFSKLGIRRFQFFQFPVVSFQRLQRGLCPALGLRLAGAAGFPRIHLRKALLVFIRRAHARGHRRGGLDESQRDFPLCPLECRAGFLCQRGVRRVPVQPGDDLMGFGYELPARLVQRGKLTAETVGGVCGFFHIAWNNRGKGFKAKSGIQQRVKLVLYLIKAQQLIVLYGNLLKFRNNFPNIRRLQQINIFFFQRA